ncbi:acyltransferase family protein [Sulfitobacter sp. JB4-11]|uniref:acyltransferase family protein n=1 Tax=Sulfitobacter rhodophyticola TaxID=3238304 RepID=UPI0035125D63
MQITRVYGDTDFITGLRAIAASMVVIIHKGAFDELGILGQTVTSAGKYGVDIFFVISGFTIAKTFGEATSFRHYLFRRLMRIVPLYWMVLVVATLLWQSGQFTLPYWMQLYDVGPDFYNLIVHMTMLSYLDYRIANSLLGVEWSIPIEVFSYVVMPAVLFLGRTIPRTLLALFGLLLLTAILSHISKEIFGTSRPISWSPVASGHLFFVGVPAFYLRRKLEAVEGLKVILWIAGALIMYAIAMALDFGGRDALIAVATAVLIIFVTPARAGWLTKVLTTRLMLFVGSVSYSLYLIHLLVAHILTDLQLLPPAGLITFGVVFCISVALSTLTYVLVERPTNELGRRIVKKREAARAPA